MDVYIYMPQSTKPSHIINFNSTTLQTIPMVVPNTSPEKPSLAPWAVMVPFPAIGHINPMLRFAEALHHHGQFRSIMVLPSFLGRHATSTTVTFITITDGLGNGATASAVDFTAIEYSMENHMPSQLEALLENLIKTGDGCSVGCVVVDLLASWALEVGRRCRIPVAGFWPAMLTTYRIVEAIPCMMEKGIISESGIPMEQSDHLLDNIACTEAKLTTKDLPWLVPNKASQKSRFMFWLRTLARSKSLTINLITNSFSNNNNDIFFQVAPLIYYQHKKNIIKSTRDRCMKWLDLQRSMSVVYVSFGTWVGPVGAGQVGEIALGLEAMGRPFLWVLNESWSWDGLPDGFLGRVEAQGSKVVNWAPQKEVLRHTAIGCHISHCGWNSIMESIEGGKCLICHPVSGDQAINCGYVVGVWGIGVKMEVLETGELERCVGQVMDANGEDMRNRVGELRGQVFGEEGVGRATKSLEAFAQQMHACSQTFEPLIP